MTSQRRSRVSRGRTRPRREPLMWTSATLSDQSDVQGSVTVFDALGGFTSTEKHNISGVVRIITKFIWRAATAAQLAEGAFGLILLDDDAMAVPAVSDPFLEAQSPWVMHSFYGMESAEDTSRTIDLDNKARRRIPIRKTLAFSMEISAVSGSVEWSVYMRILLQRGR